MEIADVIKRNFRMGDQIMLLHAEGSLLQFIKHKTDFTAKFNDLKDPFAANMQAKIDYCRTITRDREILTDQEWETEGAQTEMENGRYIFQYVLGYLLNVQKKDATARKNFGQPEYKESCRSTTKLPILLEKAYTFVNEAILKQKLLDKGATEADILSLHDTGKAITAALQSQTSVKGGRTSTKDDRIISLNNVWADYSFISGCAKTVYMNNYAMYHVFVLYPKDDREAKTSRKGKNKGKDDTPEQGK